LLCSDSDVHASRTTSDNLQPWPKPLLSPQPLSEVARLHRSDLVVNHIAFIYYLLLIYLNESN
jgi:hypothetical protein